MVVILFFFGSIFVALSLWFFQFKKKEICLIFAQLRWSLFLLFILSDQVKGWSSGSIKSTNQSCCQCTQLGLSIS